MITLQTLTDFKNQESEIKEWLKEKCGEYKGYTLDSKHSIISFFIGSNEIHVTLHYKGFEQWEPGSSSDYTIDLPLDIVFEPNFKELIQERLDDERREKRIQKEK